MTDTLIESNSRGAVMPTPHAGQQKVLDLNGRFKIAV